MQSLEGTENAIDLPASQDRPARPVCGPLLSDAEGEFVHIGKLQDLGDVEIRRGAIAIPRNIRGPKGFGPVTIFGHIDGP